MENRFETFTLQIGKISRCIRKIKEQEMKEYGLKGIYVSCLYYLYSNGGTLTSKELCDACFEDKAAISRALEFLEKNSYIECKSKTEKRYKAPINLTEKGEIVGKGIAKKIDSVLDISSDGLNKAERETFYKGLLMISDNLQKICDKYEE